MLLHTALSYYTHYGKLLVTAIQGHSHAGTHKSNSHHNLQGARRVITLVIGSTPNTITCQHLKS